MPMFRLSNPVKSYDWGHPSRIPDFLGIPNPEGLPVAEVWMGTHPGGPSLAETAEGPRNLQELHPAGLPFLFKVLAAKHALSIQAHPALAQARAGFARDNERGLALEDPHRNYKDPNHKPEVLVALDAPFWGLAGFRELQALRGDLIRLLRPAPDAIPLLAELLDALDRGGLQAFTRTLLRADPAAWRKQEPAYHGALTACIPSLLAWYERLVEDFPGDPSAIFLLALNLFRLEPGQALFTPPGCLHAYLDGFGLELMTASDNVLRGGLTRKPVDRDELERVATFAPATPRLLQPRMTESGEAFFDPPVPDFQLARSFDLGMAGSPWLLIVTEGQAEIHQGEQCLACRQGDSIVILPDSGNATILLSGTLYRAWAE
jgi:mannose-6-phosphate isomerase